MIVQPSPTLDTDWLREVRASRAFSFGTTVAAVAAQYSHCQLYNPASSGVLVLVYGVIPTPSSTIIARLSSYATALTTDHGSAPNLRLGQAGSVASVRSETNAAILGTTLFEYASAVNQPVMDRLRWPAVLDEGQGLLSVITTVNLPLRCSFMWVELPQ